MKLIYLILILTLNVSYVEKESTEEKASKPKLVVASKSDTLKFTSGIRAIFQDSKGNYWFGSHNEGVGFYDGKSFEYFTTSDGLSDNQIRSIQEDKNGKIWFGTAKGANVYDKKTGLINYLTKTNTPKYDWNETNGDLWFYAGEEDGISRSDGMDMNYLIFPKPKNKSSASTYGVTDISKAKDGKVWIATYSALFSYDGNKISVFENEQLNLEENSVLHIRSVLADSKGRIWIGNNGIGVLLKEGETTISFSKRNNLIHPKSTGNGNKSEPGTLEHVFAIEEDLEGNIWFGDRDTGAWKYDGNTLSNYSIGDKISSPMTWTIYRDNNNNVLFGMADGSIYRFNGKFLEKQF
jgi:ligand-binding sensor domain-containing protein